MCIQFQKHFRFVYMNILPCWHYSFACFTLRHFFVVAVVVVVVVCLITSFTNSPLFCCCKTKVSLPCNATMLVVKSVITNIRASVYVRLYVCYKIFLINHKCIEIFFSLLFSWRWHRSSSSRSLDFFCLFKFRPFPLHKHTQTFTQMHICGFAQMCVRECVCVGIFQQCSFLECPACTFSCSNLSLSLYSRPRPRHSSLFSFARLY